MAYAQRPRDAAMAVFATILTIGLGLSVLFAGYEATRPGVYWSRVQLHFLEPPSSQNPNVLRSTSAALIAAAGVIAKTVDPSGGENRVASESITLADQGIRHGSAVTLPNSGGQWSLSYDEPWLDVEAVGSTPDEVNALIDERLAEVNQALDAMQTNANVSKVNRIMTRLVPASRSIYYQSGSKIRAGIASLVLGAGASWLVAAFARNRLRGRLAKRLPVRRSSTAAVARISAGAP